MLIAFWAHLFRPRFFRWFLFHWPQVSNRLCILEFSENPLHSFTSLVHDSLLTSQWYILIYFLNAGVAFPDLWWPWLLNDWPLLALFSFHFLINFFIRQYQAFIRLIAQEFSRHYVLLFWFSFTFIFCYLHKLRACLQTIFVILKYSPKIHQKSSLLRHHN